MAIGLEVRELMRKCDAEVEEARDNIERGAEGGMARENVELQKLAMILVLCSAMVLSQCQNWSCTEMIYPMLKLTFKST